MILTTARVSFLKTGNKTPPSLYTARVSFLKTGNKTPQSFVRYTAE